MCLFPFEDVLVYIYSRLYLAGMHIRALWTEGSFSSSIVHSGVSSSLASAFGHYYFESDCPIMDTRLCACVPSGFITFRSFLSLAHWHFPTLTQRVDTYKPCHPPQSQLFSLTCLLSSLPKCCKFLSTINIAYFLSLHKHK